MVISGGLVCRILFPAVGNLVDVSRSKNPFLLCSGVWPMCIFTMRLTHGTMVVVHPIMLDDKTGPFLPCVYGYAMTTRRAQGSTQDGGVVLYFDLWRPASRGFAYVGGSRVRDARSLYYFGKVRRSDWLPVGGDPTNEEPARGHDSISSSESGRSRSESEYSSEQESDDERTPIPSDEEQLYDVQRLLRDGFDEGASDYEGGDEDDAEDAMVDLFGDELVEGASDYDDVDEDEDEAEGVLAELSGADDSMEAAKASLGIE